MLEWSLPAAFGDSSIKTCTVLNKKGTNKQSKTMPHESFLKNSFKYMYVDLFVSFWIK